MTQTMAFLGATDGLGAAVLEKAIQSGLGQQFLLLGRNPDKLNANVEKWGDQITTHLVDFTKLDQLEPALNFLNRHQPQQIFYFAGGGPYGEYGSKAWKDHQWALDVSLLTPSRILHHFLHKPEFVPEQIVFVGSEVADSKPDPFAASYAAAKHGLKGLVESVNAEGCPFRLQLFRPGYMATKMLPPGSDPRERGLAADPAEVAPIFLDFVGL